MMRLLQFLFIALFTISISACNTAQRFVESGDYDSAIDYCVRKLQGKKNKKTEYVRALELAFRKAQDRDIRLVDNLVAENRPENWEKINRIHRNIGKRQDKINPLLPLVAKDGYEARFIFVTIEKLERQSREKAADYLYDCAEDLLRQAGRGDRLAAREAYSTLIDLETRYFKSYRNAESLKQEARRLGIAHILFEVNNQSNQVIPQHFFDRVMSIGTHELDGEWKNFHLKADPGIQMNYRVKFNVRRVEISPERVQERRYSDQTEIQDGFDYELDARGNVKKDSLGNDIKKPRYLVVRADVLEIFQSKAVRLSGILEVFDAAAGTRLDSDEIGTEIVFENYASTFKGDQRALSSESRRRIGNQPLPFPSTEDMLTQAADKLKYKLRDELQRNRAIL